MRRFVLTSLVLSLLFGGGIPAAQAQIGDMQYFAEFDGLDRVVARSWTAPLAGFLHPATPVTTPGATPVADTGIQSLSIFVYLFESDDDAVAGYERIDADLASTRESDPSAPMEDELALAGVGDRSNGYIGKMDHVDVELTFTFATVQDGPFVYSLSGVFTGDNGEALTHSFAEALVATPTDRMSEQFDPAGASRGGLWRKLNAVEPQMPEGSTVTDLEVYPLPESARKSDTHF